MSIQNTRSLSQNIPIDTFKQATHKEAVEQRLGGRLGPITKAR